MIPARWKRTFSSKDLACEIRSPKEGRKHLPLEEWDGTSPYFKSNSVECLKKPALQEQQDGRILRNRPQGHTNAFTRKWNKDAKPLSSRRSFSSQFKPWPIPWPKLAAGSMDGASCTLTSSRGFPWNSNKICQGDRLSPQGFPENYSPITDLLDDGCKRPFLEQKESPQ